MFDAANFSGSDEDHSDDGGLSMRPLGSSAGAEVSERKKSIPVAMPAAPEKQTQGNGSPTAKRFRQRRENTITASRFHELYFMSEELLGQGAYASVRTCVNQVTGKEYAVKVIEKRPGYMNRSRVIKEIETFHLCEGHPNIVQLVEYFEEDDKFYLVFEKMDGGHLLAHIQRHKTFSEAEALLVVKDLTNALKFLHDKGIAHRDVKPENILCTRPDHVSPVKLCDLDLASPPNSGRSSVPLCITTPELQSPVGSAEFLSPEVVDVFLGDKHTYDKRCDLWSLGVILYIMLCGYPPFYGECSKENCGWDRGLACSDCQECLFMKIQKGEYYFYEDDWQGISEEAKDLIRHLLVKDKTLRYTADDVSRHAWLLSELEAPKTPLATPCVLQRNDSVRDCKQLDENFNAFQRVILGDCSNTAAAGVRLSQEMRRATGVSPLPRLLSGARLSAGRRTPTTPRDSCGGAVVAAGSLGGGAESPAAVEESVFVRA